MVELHKRMVRLGNLPDEATAQMVRAACAPFGDLLSLQMPPGAHNRPHRRFAIVTYDKQDDAADAVDNLHNAELCGCTLNVALASSKQLGHAASRHRPVWETDDAETHQLADEPAASEAVVVTDRYAKMANTNAR